MYNLISVPKPTGKFFGCDPSTISGSREFDLQCLSILESVVPEEVEESLFAGLPVLYLLYGDDKELGQVIYGITTSDVPEVKIYWLQVYDEFQGKGFGKLLLKEFITRLKKYNILLDVLHENFIAISLYKSLGFVEVGRDQSFIQMKLGEN